jgi:hypothetical protein
MFYGFKNEVREALHLMQRKVCGYDGLFVTVEPSFCDCKYGYSPTTKMRDSEATGCPELRTVVDLLDKMTEEEYNNILLRERKR